MKKGKWIWIGIVALSLSGFTGIGSSYAQTGELLRVAFPADARSFDPGITTRDYAGYAVIGGIYDFLVQYDKKPNKDGTVTVDTTKVDTHAGGTMGA